MSIFVPQEFSYTEKQCNKEGITMARSATQIMKSVGGAKKALSLFLCFFV
jgi:hypothetical protein